MYKIFVGDIRNDLYVILEKGEFEKGNEILVFEYFFTIYIFRFNYWLWFFFFIGLGKIILKNVEVFMCVIGFKGKVIEVCNMWLLKNLGCIFKVAWSCRV